MIKNFTRVALIALTLTSMGCATIINGSKQTVDFTSQPTGAKVTINGKEYGTTPTSVSLKRNATMPGVPISQKHYDVKIEMEGYFPYEIKVKREFNGWFLGNLLIGGIVGIIIDAATGSMYKLTPDQVIAQLGRQTASTTKQKTDDIFIAITLNVDPSWEKIGQLEKK
ncbi:PEGA domain-containing protein [Pontibacter pudoricolor]|uniref:PEGA domain-containing protein n=1 Tax=Pontibacter pudoricolor TaxID=2694930 RepID=UPI00192E7AD5|nr:PEGA domain-containing protein [Pontibacter pudoricolor]